MTGVMLAIVWVIEAGIVFFMSFGLPYNLISSTPFCERSMSWLDSERHIDTLAAFEDPTELAALRAGDLGPLTAAKPRTPGNPIFARLTMKHSPTCEDFCTLNIVNVVTTYDNEGKATEKTQDLTPELVLPKMMLEMVTRFENFDRPAAASETASS